MPLFLSYLFKQDYQMLKRRLLVHNSLKVFDLAIYLKGLRYPCPFGNQIQGNFLVKQLALSECVALIILISLFFKKCILRRSTLLKKISVFGAKKCWIRFASKFQRLRVIHNLLKDSLPRTKVFQTLERNKQHKLYIL